MAMVFLNSSKGNVFGPLLKELQNDMMKGNDNYPTTITRAYDLINRYETVNQQASVRRNPVRNGNPSFRRAHQFAQETREAPAGTVFVPGTDGSTLHTMRCYECGQWGHGRRTCPSRPNQTGTGLTQVGVCLTAAHDGINNDWLLLDSCSTVSCMKNEAFVTDVTHRSLDESLRVYTNGGHQDYRMTGTLQVLPLEVYVNPGSMANIISLRDVFEKYRVTMDTKSDPSMLVHHEDGKAYRFKSCGKGLFHMSLNNPDIVEVTNNQKVTPYSFLSTVASNKEYFTRHEIEGADRARDLQQYLDWPADQYIIEQLQHNRITNCPVTPDDVKRATAIYGKAIPILKGKLVRKTPKHIETTERIPIHPELAH